MRSSTSPLSHRDHRANRDQRVSGRHPASSVRPGPWSLRAIVALGAVVAAVLLGASPAHAADGDPFDRTTGYVFIAQGNPERLYQATTGADGATSLEQVGGPASVAVNAIGYNQNDDYIYGIATTKAPGAAIPYSALVRIGQGNVVTRVGSGLAGIGAKAGAVSGNLLYAFESDTSGEDPKRVVMMDTRTGDTVGAFELDSDPGLRDITFADGFAWGMDALGRPVRLDFTGRSNTVSVFPAVLPPSANYGAAWTYGNGNLGFSSNNTGVVYQVQVTNPAGSPTFTVVSSTPGPSSTLNDGTASSGVPVDLGITATVTPAAFVPGEQLHYTFTVTDHAAVGSSGSIVTATLPPGLTDVATTTPGCAVDATTVRCARGPLAPGASSSVMVTARTTTTTDTAVTATATVLGNEVDDVPANNTASAETVPVLAAIRLTKTVSPATVTAAGQHVTYQFSVTNTGDADLADVAVLDRAFSGTGRIPQPTDCPTEALPGAVATCTADYVVTQADIDAGRIDNTATVSGTTTGGTTVTSAPASALVTVTQQAALRLTQTVDPGRATEPGTLLHYAYVVTNTGNVTASAVTLVPTSFDGSAAQSPITCSASTLAPGASATCASTYSVTAQDIVAGRLTNVVTAVGEDPAGGAVRANSTTTDVLLDATVPPTGPTPGPGPTTGPADPAGPDQAELARTGTGLGTPTAVGAGLLAAGTMTLLAGRRRRRAVSGSARDRR